MQKSLLTLMINSEVFILRQTHKCPEINIFLEHMTLNLHFFTSFDPLSHFYSSRPQFAHRFPFNDNNGFYTTNHVKKWIP